MNVPVLFLRSLPAALAACAITLPVAAGPYDQPYAIITTDTKPSADDRVRPVIVNRVDGENPIKRNEAVVAPGLRVATLDLPPRKGFHQATQEDFRIEAKPCTRYYVAAKLRTTTGQGWEPVIRHEEPIGECRAKFALKDPAK